MDYINLSSSGVLRALHPLCKAENCQAQRSGPSVSSRSLRGTGKVPGGPDSLPAEEKGIMNGEKRDNDNKSCSEVFNNEALL